MHLVAEKVMVMKMILVIEMILCCVLFSIMVILGTRKNPLSGLHNMPVALQERVSSLEQYQNVEVVHTRKRILKKLPALIMLTIIFVLMIYEKKLIELLFNLIISS